MATHSTTQLRQLLDCGTEAWMTMQARLRDAGREELLALKAELREELLDAEAELRILTKVLKVIGAESEDPAPTGVPSHGVKGA